MNPYENPPNPRPAFSAEVRREIHALVEAGYRRRFDRSVAVLEDLLGPPDPGVNPNFYCWTFTTPEGPAHVYGGANQGYSVLRGTPAAVDALTTYITRLAD